MSLYGVCIAKREYYPNDATGGDEDQLNQFSTENGERNETMLFSQ
jgi:hypothetical protein